MSQHFIFLGLYFLGAIVYWLSYILIRPYVTKKQKHALLFVVHLILGIFLVGFLPAYLNMKGIINTRHVLILAFVMAVSAIIHHASILKDVQPWKGIFTPKGLKVPLIHGTLSHMSFSIAFAIYGFVLLYHYLAFANLTVEFLILLFFVAFIELVAAVVMFDGIRMFFSK